MMGFLIIVNTVLVIMDTDSRAEPDGETPAWLTMSMFFLLAMYIVELLLRLIVYRLNFFNTGINVFDFAVVSVDGFCVLLEIYGIGIGVSVSALRIVRLGRLLRFMKVLRVFHELY